MEIDGWWSLFKNNCGILESNETGEGGSAFGGNIPGICMAVDDRCDGTDCVFAAAGAQPPIRGTFSRVQFQLLRTQHWFSRQVGARVGGVLRQGRSSSGAFSYHKLHWMREISVSGFRFGSTVPALNCPFSSAVNITGKYS